MLTPGEASGGRWAMRPSARPLRDSVNGLSEAPAGCTFEEPAVPEGPTVGRSEANSDTETCLWLAPRGISPLRTAHPVRPERETRRSADTGPVSSRIDAGS